MAGITKTTELQLNSLKAEGDMRTSITSRISSEPKNDRGSDEIGSVEYLPKQGFRVRDIEHG